MATAQKAISAMLWDFLGKGGLTLIRFSESILLVRLLGNADYGTLSVLLNFQATMVLMASLGIEGVLSRFIPEYKVKDQQSQIPLLIRQATWSRGGLLLGLSALGFVLAEPLVALLFKDANIVNQPLEQYLQLVLFLIVSVGLQDLVRRILVVHYHQRLINMVELLTFCAYLGGAVLLIEWGWGIPGVLLANIASKFLTLAIFALHSRVYFKTSKSPIQLPVQEIRRIYPYAISFYLYSLMLHVLGKGGDIFILGAFVSDLSQVAFYTIAFNFAFFSTSFFELALQGGFVLPFISEVYHRGNMENVRKVYTGLFEFIYLFTIPISMGGILLASDLMEFFYGADRLGAVPMLILFFVHFSIIKIGILNSSFMLAADLQKRLIQSRVFFGGFNMVLNLMLVGPYQGVGVVWGTLITGILASIYESWCVHHLIHPRYSWQFLGKVLLATGGMGIAIWWVMPWVVLPLPLKITVLIAIGGLVYAGLLVVLKPISADNLQALQQSKLPFKKQLFRLLSKDQPSEK